MKVERAGRDLADEIGFDLEKLLTAALAEDEHAVRRAYRQWADLVDWEADFAGGTYPLLPLLYLNLERCGVEDAARGRLRGLYRRSWYRIQSLQSGLTAVTGRLTAEGIDVVVLGDLALIDGLYAKSGARVCNRLDLLVAPRSVGRALEILGDAGWRGKPLRDGDLTYLSHNNLTNMSGELLRVHWHPMCTKAKNDSYSMSSFALRSGKISVGPQILADTGHICHIVATGFDPSGSRLLADIAATYSLVRYGDVEWDAALRLADEYGFNVRLFAVCSYLVSKFSAPIPDAVIGALRDRTVSLSERLDLRLAHRSAESPDSFFGPLLRLLAHYTGYMYGSGTTRAIVGLPAFLRYHYRTRSLAKILTRIAVNGARRGLRLVKRAAVDTSARMADLQPSGANRRI
jgi:hypothetical protein